MSEAVELTPPSPASEPDAEATLGDAALRARATRVEHKPPAYRVFRVTLYGLYGLVAAWLIGTITVAVWQSVYGESGQALRRAATVTPAPPAR